MLRRRGRVDEELFETLRFREAGCRIRLLEGFSGLGFCTRFDAGFLGGVGEILPCEELLFIWLFRFDSAPEPNGLNPLDLSNELAFETGGNGLCWILVVLPLSVFIAGENRRLGFWDTGLFGNRLLLNVLVTTCPTFSPGFRKAF